MLFVGWASSDSPSPQLNAARWALRLSSSDNLLIIQAAPFIFGLVQSESPCLWLLIAKGGLLWTSGTGNRVRRVLFRARGSFHELKPDQAADEPSECRLRDMTLLPIASYAIVMKGIS